MLKFGIRCLMEPDGKSTHALGGVAYHGSDNGGGVKSTRQIGAERDVAPHPKADGIIKSLLKHPYRVIEIRNVRRCRFQRWREISDYFRTPIAPKQIATRWK